MPHPKIFCLDTSVLLYSSQSIRSFGSKQVVIPYVVLDELDKFKTRDGEVGKNARQVARELDKLRKDGRLDEGVVITPRGGTLRIELGFQECLSSYLDLSRNDDRILNVCLGLKQSGNEVVLVSKDINLKVRADVLGITAQDFNADKSVSSISDIYTGTRSIVVPDSVIDEFYDGEALLPEELGIEGVEPNCYFTLTSEFDSGKSALAKTGGPLKPFVKLRPTKNIWGISPRNREQQFAMDSLLDPNIPLVTLTGQAGTGKTLVAIACALHLVQDKSAYDRLIVSRPIQPMGKDIGYLPGSLQEKLDPWMGPIKDAVDFLTRGKAKSNNVYDHMVETGMLQVEPLTFIRGRSLPSTLFIIDEAQNLSRHEVKTIVSRMGENSKIILIGDVSQIDNPYLDPTSNGLSNVIERFKSSDLSSHITFTRGERSRLATVACEIL